MTASAPSWWMSSVGRWSRRPARMSRAIHPDRAGRPHLAVGASLGTQQSVERPVGVGDDIEGEPKVRPIRGEPLGSGEGDDGDAWRHRTGRGDRARRSRVPGRAVKRGADAAPARVVGLASRRCATADPRDRRARYRATCRRCGWSRRHPGEAEAFGRLLDRFDEQIDRTITCLEIGGAEQHHVAGVGFGDDHRCLSARALRIGSG